jgi:hypothetical protein
MAVVVVLVETSNSNSRSSDDSKSNIGIRRSMKTLILQLYVKFGFKLPKHEVYINNIK